MTIPTNQQKCLSNSHNNVQCYLTSANISVYLANNDSDVLIINRAIQKCNKINKIFEVGEDLLTFLSTLKTKPNSVD